MNHISKTNITLHDGLLKGERLLDFTGHKCKMCPTFWKHQKQEVPACPSLGSTLEGAILHTLHFPCCVKVTVGHTHILTHTDTLQGRAVEQLKPSWHTVTLHYIRQWQTLRVVCQQRCQSENVRGGLGLCGMC